MWASGSWWDTICCSPHSLERDSLSETLMKTENLLSQRKGTTLEAKTELHADLNWLLAIRNYCFTLWSTPGLTWTSSSPSTGCILESGEHRQFPSCWIKMLRETPNMQFKDTRLSREVKHSLVVCFPEEVRETFGGVQVFCRPTVNGDERRRQR